MLGMALGAAMTGFRPIVEIMYADFMFVAMDQLVNQIANARYVSEGRWTARWSSAPAGYVAGCLCPALALGRVVPGAHAGAASPRRRPPTTPTR